MFGCPTIIGKLIAVGKLLSKNAKFGAKTLILKKMGPHKKL